MQSSFYSTTLLILFISLSLLSPPTNAFSIGDWVKKVWNSISDLIPQDSEGSLEVVDDCYGLPSKGNIIAMGHFQSNLRMTVFVLDGDGGGGDGGALYSMDEDGSFKLLPNTRVKIPSSEKIHNVILSDLDHDGYCDVLVMRTSSDYSATATTALSSASAPTLKLYIYRGDGNEYINTAVPIEVPGSFIGEPVLVDLKSTTKMSLVGLQQGGAKDGRMSVWLNTAISDKDSISPPPIFREPVSLNSDVLMSSSALQWNHQADFDGDGLADLLIRLPSTSADRSPTLKIWRRTPTNEPIGIPPFPFIPSTEIELPPGAGPLTVVDIDGDGNPDLLYSVCSTISVCHLEILFSSLPPFCSNKPDGDDGKSKNCNNLSDGIFIDHPQRAPTFLKEALKIALPKDVRIPEIIAATGIPTTFSVGDFNLDSFVDVAISSVVDGRLRKALLFENVACTAKECPKHPDRRTLRLVKEAEEEYKALFEWSDVDQVAFADWTTSNGSPGFVLNRSNGGGSSKTELLTTAIRNRIVPGGETFFIRCGSLNGVDPAGNAGKNAEYPYGVGYAGGATFRMAFMDSQGLQQIRHHSQLSSLCNRSLQYPTVLVGLGRTSNYISQLTSSIPLLPTYGPQQMKSLSTIPNSQVVFIPPVSSSNENWRLELQISIVTYGWGVGVSLLISLLVLAIITTFFKWSEVREDEVERKRRSHLVNFDAL